MEKRKNDYLCDHYFETTKDSEILMFVRDLKTDEYPFAPLGDAATVKMPGGHIVLEMNVNDYSMAQIARIVEENGAKIWSSSVTSTANPVKIEITLKINQTDLTYIIQSFLRFDYTIKSSFQGNNRQEDILRNNYDQLMMYLNV